jgi:hypothetical protein
VDKKKPDQKKLPVVLKQLWIVTVQGTRYDAGCSYHLTETDRVAMVQETANRQSTDMHGELEEPLGDPVPIHTTPEYYERIKASPHGLRLK